MRKITTIAALFLGLFIGQITMAQTTELTYQGQLQSAGTAASGSFDFEFALFDAAGGGSQLGSALTRNGVAVTGGIFSVNLDFGLVFPGASRFLEIRVRPAGGGSFTTLSPRQPVNSTPYSVKSLAADTAANANTAATAGTFTGNLAGDVTGTQVSSTVERLRGRNVATAQPTNGQVLKFNSANSQWEPATDETGSGGGGGTITGVTAGTGLAGGGTTGSVTVAIANGGVGNAQIADGSVTDAKIVTVSGAKVTGAVTNSNQLGGVAASQYVLTTDARMTDARNPLPGSTGYIQNSVVSQGLANFSFEGTGSVQGVLAAVTLTGNLVNSTTQYNLNGNRVLSGAGANNLFVGVNAGSTNNSIGSNNSFFGTSSGDNITSGFSNSFFGSQSGQANSMGISNSFFGFQSGLSNITGNANAFFGRESGRSNTNGSNNSFFGTSAGQNNLAGSDNSFFGEGAGRSNTGASNNSFFGKSAGQNSSGNGNSFFGADSGLVNASGTLNAFFGSSSGQSNTIGSVNTFLGASSGLSNTSGTSNTYVGFESGRQNMTGIANVFVGHSAGFQNTASNNTFVGQNAGGATTTGANNSFFGKGAGTVNTTGANNTLIGYNAEVSSAGLTFATAIGSDSVVSSSNTVVLGRSADSVRVPGNFLSVGQISADSNLVVSGTSLLNGILRVTGGSDAEPGSGGYIISGASLLGPNVVIDDNEIMARNATSTASLFLNADGGNVGIGNTVANDTLDVDGDIRVGTGASNGCLKNNQGGLIAGTCSSDERFKRDITPFPSVLNSFTELRPVHYFFRVKEFPDKHFGPDQTYGLIAQDVEKVLPELVSLDANGFRQIDYAKLPMLTIQAVKELNAKNETQQKQIELQNKTINRQQNELDALRAFVCSKRRPTGFCRSKQ